MFKYCEFFAKNEYNFTMEDVIRFYFKEDLKWDLQDWYGDYYALCGGYDSMEDNEQPTYYQAWTDILKDVIASRKNVFISYLVEVSEAVDFLDNGKDFVFIALLEKYNIDGMVI